MVEISSKEKPEILSKVKKDFMKNYLTKNITIFVTIAKFFGKKLERNVINYMF